MNFGDRGNRIVRSIMEGRAELDRKFNVRNYDDVEIYMPSGVFRELGRPTQLLGMAVKTTPEALYGHDRIEMRHRQSGGQWNIAVPGAPSFYDSPPIPKTQPAPAPNKILLLV